MNRIKKFVSSPVVVIISFVTPILISFIIYHKQINDKEPCYYTSKESTLSSSKNLSDGFSLFWKEKRISNIKSIDLILWNDGNFCIDFNDFTKSDPIKLIPSPVNLDIHQVEYIRSSRPNLDVETKISEKDTTYVQFDFIGNEAIELHDTLFFKISYSSDTTINWKVIGRVKNAANHRGFVRKEIYHLEKSQLTIVSFVMIIISLVLLIGIILIRIYFRINPVIRKKEIFFLAVYSIVIVVKYCL